MYSIHLFEIILKLHQSESHYTHGLYIENTVFAHIGTLMILATTCRNIIDNYTNHADVDAI